MINIVHYKMMSVRGILIVVLAFFPYLAACTSESHPYRPPLALPFDVQKAENKVETELEIIEHQTYTFALEYFYTNQVERAKVWSLAGGSFMDQAGKWIEPGAALQIKLKIVRRLEGKEQPQFDGIMTNPQLTSWGGDSLKAKLTNILLEPGIYKVSAENLIDAPEFHGTKVGLRIARAYLGK